MILEKGNMWSVWPTTDRFFITANATLKKDGSLVMGRGIACEARDRFPGLDLKLGQAIGTSGKVYGILLGKKLCLFQVKFHWHEQADLSLIESSTMLLTAQAHIESEKRFDLNFPGIGNGRLAYDDVYQIIKTLPENVHVWTK